MNTDGKRAVSHWLLVLCFMVFVMVVLGGLTRLTHSGLSMVEWQPHHVLPPITAQEWGEAFEKYQQFPEYQKLNKGMSLDEFKGIFWLEYIHRLWGRAIGLVFLVPFIWFVASGRIDRRMAPKIGLIFVLGGLQGALGWYMVASGLVDRPNVSQYRLTAHLGAAFLIYGVMFWYALDMRRQQTASAASAITAGGLRRWTLILLALVTLTFLSGGFVAGLHAGFKFNTFPLMDGRLIPDHLLFPETPWLINLFEDEATVQFDHRVLAISTLCVSLFVWWRAVKANLRQNIRFAFHLVGAMALIQVALGITTLLMIVPVSIASIHQAGALVLFTLVLNALHKIKEG
jgi:cytochrome c oxidase assembly protein subunit 15